VLSSRPAPETGPAFFANGAETGAFAYLFSGAAQSAANGQNPLNDIFGKIWSLPNTALGVGVGTIDSLATLATGQLPHFDFANGALQISNLIDLSGIGGAGAITFGDIQLFNGVVPSSMFTERYPSGYTGLYGFSYGAHEGGHTIQSDVLGPLFFPLYGLGAITHGWLSNPFETNADYHAAYGTSAVP